MSENKNPQGKSQEQVFWESLTQSQKTLVIVGIILFVLAVVVFLIVIAVNYFRNPNRNAGDEARLILQTLSMRLYS